MNLQVLPFSTNTFNILRSATKVSFGEYDGDYSSYLYQRISKSEYNAKKELINEKYDNKRSSLLQDADDLGLPSTEVWKQLDNIEKMRTAELERLKIDFYI